MGGRALAHLVDWVVDGTEPPSGMPIEVLAERHGDRAGYLEQHEAALDRAIVAGFLLEADRATAVAEAEEVDFG